MTDRSRPVRYDFDGFELQPEERRLLAAGQQVALAPRAFDLLVALVERAGALVSKEELLDCVWPKLVVEEANLHVQISALRKVLGPDAIETVSGHGYRFTPRLDGSDSVRPASTPRRHNLPRQLTSFVGHEGDLEKCGRLLDRTRLLTLTGVGGLGKTRLSLEMAWARLDDFADGVWFVDLAPIADERLMLQALTSVFGVMEQAGRPVLETVIRFVSGRRLLLILDNCEHLLHACAGVARHLLQAGPDVKVLASSREPLHVPGETTFSLSALSVPDIRGAATAVAIADCESVRLFVDRATAAQPDFRLTKQNVQAVGEICAHLDGIPLALELAAARVRVMSVETIARRLNDRFQLLKGDDQTALPRQRTLRATVDWSYDLLAAHERLLLQRLAVFAGGWTMDAAEAIAGFGEIDASEVLDLTIHLTEKSLVVVAPDGSRYRLLETVRHYAKERLDASAEADQTRTRHLAFYLALAEGAHAHFLSPDEAAWAHRLDDERENLRAAYAWCNHAVGGAATALRLALELADGLCPGHYDLRGPVMADALAPPGAQQRNLSGPRDYLQQAFSAATRAATTTRGGTRRKAFRSLGR